jgi:hypothetical protein
LRSAMDRTLRITGTLLFIYGIFGLFWPPMHQREVLAAGGGSLTDILHIVFAVITVLLMLVIIITTAVAMGRNFRIYSVITIIVLLIFGGLTASVSPDMEKDLPTPWMGVWERISIFAFLAWIIVLTIILLRRIKNQPAT